MGFFGGLFRTGKTLGKNIGGAFGDAANRTGVSAKIAIQISTLEMEQKKLEKEYDDLCLTVGKKYIEYLIETQNEPEIDLSSEIRRLDPNLKRREEIENEIAALKVSEIQNQSTEEFNNVQQEYFTQKKKLDQALRGGIITQDEYDEKLSVYKSQVENFDEIQRIKAQYDMGIIKKDEMKKKLRALGAEV